MSTQTQLTALEEAIFQGALIVEYDGKKVEYRSLNEMILIRNMLRKELGLISGTNRAIYHSTSGGHDTDSGSDNGE